ncbi:TraB/GumN family protein [Uliginosibacterium sp. 31-16]|uniref:TraB/GumN family protein n=1 Tax=Uliginosibacterium sp. 31-16 TaxID=3068315 RepID=UPI00273F12A1|nr:TraB/GumN family protein [Uliginosibacterium sp. 31-16]MDP5240413.1 TraB/GumN family protein [Uliginosibacterium sp. 31-16]
MLRWVLAACCALAAGLALAAGPKLPLWEASKPDGATVYLFGSIHVCNAGCFPLPEKVLRRLEASQVLVVELDPKRPEAQGKLLAAAMLPAGQRLGDLLSAADWQALVGAARELGLPAEALAPLQPWMAGMLLSVASAQQAGYEIAQGVDMALMQRAAQQGMTLEELESIEEQIAALGAGSLREQQQALRLTVDLVRGGRASSYLAAMISAWRSGNAAQVNRLLNEGLPKGSTQTRALIDERNVVMSQRIVRSMQDGRSRFVVVGMAHLVGPQGVPALLGRQGYRVRQLGVEE